MMMVLESVQRTCRCYRRARRSERRAYERADINTLAFALTGSQRYQQQKVDVHPVADRTLTVLQHRRRQERSRRPHSPCSSEASRSRARSVPLDLTTTSSAPLGPSL